MVTRPHTALSARIGAYALEVGVHVSSFAQFASSSSRAERSLAKKNAAALRSALAEPDEQQQSPTALEAAEEFEKTADAVTDRVEHANKLFRAVSEDQLVDPNLITGEIGSLLGLLDRLDREGRYDEEIRVAKALHGLCVLAFRWLDLVRSLRAALAAARAAGDEAGQAWALNELGALHLCAGNGDEAAECLDQALELQETLGDAGGRCATRHNRDSAGRDVARPIQLAAPRRLLTPGGMVRSFLVAGMLAVAVLTGLGATAVADMFGNGGDDGAGPLVVTIDHRPPNPSASSMATFSFSAENANGFECKLDKRAFEGCQSPAQYTDLKAGAHTFRVRATAQGQNGPTAKEVWRVDLTAPTTTITAKPAARATETSAVFQFKANEEVQSFQCRLGDALFTACASPKNVPGPLAEGTHVFAVRAIDLAGNVGEADKYQWRISTSGKTAVPNIVGMQLARGLDALEKVQLTWEKREITSTKPVGQIVSQDPRAGEQVPVETTVEVGVSIGIDTVAVPNLVGLASSSALAELEQAGLQANIVQASSNSMPEGHVLKQNPDPGTEVARGSTVDITVSTGSPPDLTVAIPTDGVEVSCPAGAGSCVTTVTFTVTNQGKGAASETFEVLVSADPGETRTVTLRGGLAAGASTIRKAQLGPGGNCYDPDCSVQVTADPLGRVPERNERNNVAQWTRIG
jgi:beta-lactam-binding protein with PASTA domain/tetratricopeptide (TPR) repeat protein